ncbi:MAG: sulfur reductase DrsE [Paenibacillaceae bacterium]
MKKKRIIYFVTLSQNAEIVLKQAIDMSSDHEVMIFFDLDGARVLDPTYLKQQAMQQCINLSDLLHKSIQVGIKLFGCQINVLNAVGMKMMDGVELAGVVTFLDLAYEADAVLSY